MKNIQESDKRLLIVVAIFVLMVIYAIYRGWAGDPDNGAFNY